MSTSCPPAKERQGRAAADTAPRAAAQACSKAGRKSPRYPVPGDQARVPGRTAAAGGPPPEASSVSKSGHQGVRPMLAHTGNHSRAAFPQASGQSRISVVEERIELDLAIDDHIDVIAELRALIVGAPIA